MKISLTINNGRIDTIDINVRTNPESNVLTWLLTSEYGTMYKELYIDGWYFRRNHDPKKYGTVSIDFKERDWDEYDTAYLELTRIGADLKDLSDIELIDKENDWFKESGEYLAIGFNGIIYAGVDINGHTTSMAFPIKDVENHINNPNLCYLVGCSDRPVIEASGADEACFNVWNYRIRFGETVIMVELDDNPVETVIYAIN